MFLWCRLIFVWMSLLIMVIVVCLLLMDWLIMMLFLNVMF